MLCCPGYSQDLESIQAVRLRLGRSEGLTTTFPVTLRIAFDLDGVLADMESELLRQAEVVFGERMARKLQVRAEALGPNMPEPSNDDIADATDPIGVADDTLAATTPPLVKLNMTSRQQRRLWRHIATIENFWELLTEIEPGTIARLARVAAERQWEIIFLTKRPQTAGATAQVQSQRWLESKGFSLPSVYVVQGSRGRIAAALGLDIVIDDRPENCLDVVADSPAKAVLVWREDKQALPAAANRLGIGVAHSVMECLDILVTIDSRPPRDSTIVGRVKRFLRSGEASDT